MPHPEIRTGPVVAIDRGITHLLADSDGELVANPQRLEQSLKKLRRAQRVVARRKKGSRRRERAKIRVAKIHRKIRRQRTHVLHELSSRYAKSHGVVVLENLNIAGMVKGTRPPYRGRRMGHLLHDAPLQAGGHGGQLVEVPAHYSSQTCPACDVVDAASRDGERFCCVACGHTAHADLNAAIVLLSRRNGGGAGRGGFPDVRGPAKRQRSGLQSG